MLPLRHRRLWIATSVVLVTAVVFGSLQPTLAMPAPGGYDKLQHALAYFALAWWFTGLYPRDSYWKVVTGLLALGFAMELLQGWMQLGRQAELLDMVANAVGVATGLALALVSTGGWTRRIESWLIPN